MNIGFIPGCARGGVLVQTQGEVAFGGKRIVMLELLSGEIPMSIDPVWVARSEVQLFGTVRFGQFARFARLPGSPRISSRAQGVAFARPAHRRRRRGVSLQQNRRDLQGWLGFGSAYCGRD